MHTKYALLAVTALALVTGCNRGAGNNAAANKSTTSNTANAAAPAPAVAAGAVDRNAVVGHWGRGGDCSKTVSFNADGTGAATGETGGTWALEGNTLVLSGPNEPTQRMTVTSAGETLTLAGGPGGQSMTMTRCAAAGTGGAAAGAPPAAAAADEEEADAKSE